MTGYHKQFTAGTADLMAKLIKSEQNAGTLKRIQCIYLRAKFDYPADVIAEIVGFHKQTVLNIHSRYFKSGIESLDLKAKGGRMRENMTIQEEQEFLSKFIKDSDNGLVLEISNIKFSLEKELGKSISNSTVYALLHRHGWRKIAPRAYHPKRDLENQETFKKTLNPTLIKQSACQKQKD